MGWRYENPEALFDGAAPANLAPEPSYKECEGVVEAAFGLRPDGSCVTEHVMYEGNSRLSAKLEEPAGAPYHIMIQTGGGMIEGEKYRVAVKVEDGARAVLATQAPTYIYKCETGGRCEQHSVYAVGKDAMLELYQDEIIAYRNARYRQFTDLYLDRTSTLVLSDGLTSGWSPDGDLFAYTGVDTRTRVFVDGKLLVNDHLISEPDQADQKALGFFEGETVMTSLMLVDARLDPSHVESLRAALGSLGFDGAHVRYGVTALDEHGLVLRVLGDEAQVARRLVFSAANWFRTEVCGLPAMDLRKNDMFVY
jgi:urease accessory protein